MTEIAAPETVQEYIKPEGLGEMQLVGKSTRVKFQKIQYYVPRIAVSKYAVDVSQLEYHRKLHPDAQMLFIQTMPEEQLDGISAIMTQLLLKEVLKQWVPKSHNAVHSDRKILNFRNTFKPMNWEELYDIQSTSVLDSHMFLNKNRDGKIKGHTLAGGNKQIVYISKEDTS